MEIFLNWTELKSISTLKTCNLQYVNRGSNYFVFIADDGINYTVTIDITNPRNADQIDFEDNYQINANKRITPLVTFDGKLKVETYQAANTVNEIKIKDGEGNNRFAKVDVSGRLLVSQEAPTPPPSTTAVKITEYGAIAEIVDNIYIIPNTKTLYIQRLSASAEIDSTGGNAVELYYDPNGTGIDMIIIEVMFVGGNSYQKDLNDFFVGNGIRAIRMRRRRLSGGSKNIFARWEGYY